MHNRVRNSERGQSLFFVALIIFALIGMLALAIDGGFAYYNRRIAQSAADSGALAGASYLCDPANRGSATLASDSQSIAIDYTLRNEAQWATAAVNVASRNVQVTDSITYTTFFGSLLNQPTMRINAFASASCFAPNLGNGVLPVVWSCQPPVVGWGSDSGSCQQQRVTWDELQDYLNNNPIPPCNSDGICPELYVVMDSDSYANDFYCIEEYPLTGTLHCDLDGDGEPDYLAGGGRSWADLDGNVFDCEGTSEGAQELKYWIEFGYPCDLLSHTWISKQSGVAAAIYDVAEQRRQTNPVVLIPVFDDYCDDYPSTDPLCAGKYHPGIDTINAMTSTGIEYFHIITFAAFYITCVNDVDVVHQADQACPGIKKAVELNPDLHSNIDAIEGYFLEGPVPGLDGRSDTYIDTGVYTIYLDR